MQKLSLRNDPKFSDRLILANSVDPDQTAAVWKEYAVFANLPASFGSTTQIIGQLQQSFGCPNFSVFSVPCKTLALKSFTAVFNSTSLNTTCLIFL